MVKQFEIYNCTSKKFYIRKLPIPKIPCNLEELELFIDRHESLFEAVDGVADLIAIHGTGEGSEYSLQTGLQLLRIFNGVSILKNDDQNLAVREMPNKFRVFLQVAYIGQRNAYRDTAHSQSAYDSGNLRTRWYLLVLKWAFQIDAKPDAIIIHVGTKCSFFQNCPQKRSRQKNDREHLLQHAADATLAKRSFDTLVQRHRLVGVAVPSEERLVDIHCVDPNRSSQSPE